MHQDTFYWHDYETFGIDPQRDRPVQFAGVRTDTELNVIGEPLNIICKPADDYLPNPEACLITGITPQFALQKGVCEAGFIRLINLQLMQSHTCTIGYNNIRFDDEVTRNVLYRNFYDPYAREWQNGNSRWDLIDLVRATRALRPEGINWPDREEGVPSFRLEELTAANGLEHSSAHDALSDVYATIAFAKLIQKAQPKLFQFVFTHRSKANVKSLLDLGSMMPLLHVSGMYPSTKGCLAMVVPLCKHPVNNNGVLVYDLSVDPDQLLSLSAEEIRNNIFTATEKLPEGTQRIPIKTVHINKCPVLAPEKVLRADDAERLSIDRSRCQLNLQKLNKQQRLKRKLNQVFSHTSYAEIVDPDLMIYSGGFFNDKDKSSMDLIRNSTIDELSGLQPKFFDQRLAEMLFRYRGRNFPQTLSDKEQLAWREFCRKRISGEDSAAGTNKDDYLATITALRERQEVDTALLDSLEEYIDVIST